MTRYAIYVLVVEDTEENDQRVADLYADSMERVAGNTTLDDATEALREMQTVGAEYDLGIARGVGG